MERLTEGRGHKQVTPENVMTPEQRYPWLAPHGDAALDAAQSDSDALEIMPVPEDALRRSFRYGTSDEQSRKLSLIEHKTATYGLPDETPGEMLNRKYTIESRSTNAIARELQVNGKVVARWLSMHEIQMRSRNEAVALFWSNEANRSATLKKIHSPDASLARSQAISRAMKDDEHLRFRMANWVKEQQRERVLSQLGDNPAVLLASWRHEQRRGLQDIAKGLGTSIAYLRQVFHEFGVNVAMPKSNRGKPTISHRTALVGLTEPEIVARLSERQLRVVQLRVMAAADSPVPAYQEIAEQLGVSSETVRKDEIKAIRRLRALQRQKKRVAVLQSA